MPNGRAALHLAFEPAQDAPAEATVGKSRDATEIAVGEAMAAAVTGLGCALAEFENGGLCPETRTANGERIARLYELQQSLLGEIDFAAVAHEQGRIALRQYLAEGGFYGQHTTEQGDAVLDMLIGDVLTVVARVTAIERAMAN